jgi:hypothetical protein
VTAPPSQWPDKAMRVALIVLAIAVMLHIAAQLIVSVWPVLLAVGLVVLVGFAVWAVNQFHKSRW